MWSPGLMHVRIDDRMIHGQVAVYWCRFVGATRIMVANDEMHSNEIQKAALRMVVPPGLRSSLLDVETAAANLSSGKYVGQRVILVVRRPSDILRMLDAGVGIEAVNVGNLPAREGTVTVKNSIDVTPEELDQLRELDARGVHLTGKQVPDNSDEDLMVYINRL